MGKAMDFINSDRTLKVGDLVFSNYHKGEILFRIINITRRYLTQYHMLYDVYKDAQIGDEYTPLMTIEVVADLSLFANLNKKLRKNANVLDASYLRRVDPVQIQEHIKRLNQLLDQFWP